MEILVAVFTMKGCPHCTDFKELLKEENINFSELDIDEYTDEYNMFVDKTSGNEYVPSFMVFEVDGDNHRTFYYAPERDYEELEDGIKIIKKHRRKVNI